MWSKLTTIWILFYSYIPIFTHILFSVPNSKEFFAKITFIKSVPIIFLTNLRGNMFFLINCNGNNNLESEVDFFICYPSWARRCKYNWSQWTITQQQWSQSQCSPEVQANIFFNPLTITVIILLYFVLSVPHLQLP